MATRTEARDQFLTDILCIAVEGGINHWVDGEDYRYNGDPAGRGVTLTGWAGEPGDSDEDPIEFPLRLDLDLISSGVNQIVTGQVDGIDSELVAVVGGCNFAGSCAPDHGTDIDADIADAIVQVAVLGELVFS